MEDSTLQKVVEIIQRVTDMEEVLTQDRARTGRSDDAAWETSSMRKEFGSADRA